MPKKIDLTGRRFGNLVVIRQVDHIQYNCGRKQVAWECRCDCGNVKTVSGALLRRGDTTSCGCIQRKIARQNALYRNIKHGMSYTRLHVIWEGMKARCCNPNATGYDRYGGKGVSVCSDWLDFVNFAEWAK